MSPQKPTVFSSSLRHKFRQDLEALFDLALQKEDFSAALKAKELLGKEQGFFDSTQGKAKGKKEEPLLDLENLTDEELTALIQKLEHENFENR